MFDVADVECLLVKSRKPRSLITPIAFFLLEVQTTFKGLRKEINSTVPEHDDSVASRDLSGH
jgi:hypothetical protein